MLLLSCVHAYVCVCIYIYIYDAAYAHGILAKHQKHDTQEPKELGSMTGRSLAQVPLMASCSHGSPGMPWLEDSLLSHASPTLLSRLLDASRSALARFGPGHLSPRHEG